MFFTSSSPYIYFSHQKTANDFRRALWYSSLRAIFHATKMCLLKLALSCDRLNCVARFDISWRYPTWSVDHCVKTSAKSSPKTWKNAFIGAFIKHLRELHMCSPGWYKSVGRPVWFVFCNIKSVWVYAENCSLDTMLQNTLIHFIGFLL